MYPLRWANVPVGAHATQVVAHGLDIALIKLLDESASIKYCLCTVLVNCTVIYSFLVKRYVLHFG